LPAVAARVGGEPVDQLSCAQGVVLLNRFNYRPRPVFQSYSAYTPGLLAANAAFYRGGRAPAYVLWRWGPIDGRLPALEDGPALLEIFERYRLVTCEKGFLLLERLPEGAGGGEAARPELRRQVVAFGEEVGLSDLPRVPHAVAIEIEGSAWGRVARALYRPPPLWIELRLEDGQTCTYRLIPALAGSGFLLNPLLRDDGDVVKLYRGRPLPRVRAFTVRAGPGAGECYWDRLRVTVREAGPGRRID
jgi:hypothetical protein